MEGKVKVMGKIIKLKPARPKPSDLLVDVFDIFLDYEITRASTKMILSILNEKKDWSTSCKGEHLHPHCLAGMLKEFGIKPSPVRIPGAKSQLKGYKKEDFDKHCS